MIETSYFKVIDYDARSVPYCLYKTHMNKNRCCVSVALLLFLGELQPMLHAAEEEEVSIHQLREKKGEVGLGVRWSVASSSVAKTSQYIPYLTIFQKKNLACQKMQVNVVCYFFLQKWLLFVSMYLATLLSSVPESGRIINSLLFPPFPSWQSPPGWTKSSRKRLFATNPQYFPSFLVARVFVFPLARLL